MAVWCGGIGTYAVRSLVRRSPYVPPVAEQLAAIAALPAEEILVRGSEQPIAVPRAASRGAG